MKQEIFNIRKMGLLLVAALLLSIAFASCSSDDVVKTQLETPTIVEGNKTVSSLAFNWQAVSGATQYAYELYDADGEVVLGDVTSAISIITTGLEPNTTYTLKVWAYADVNSDKTTSPIATITATTTAKVPLSNPVPEAHSANGGVTISWPAVEHADKYRYSYVDADGNTVEGEVETNSVTLTNLSIGEYTIQIIATSDDEAYSDSEPIQLTFQRTKAETWRRNGTYTSAGMGVSYKATIVAYDDGSYTIEAPFGEDGYSISFTVDADSKEITPIGVAPDQYGYYPINVSSQNYVTIYTSSNYSEFSGDENEGEVWFGSYTYDNDGNLIGDWGYDDFTWADGDDIPEGCKAEVPAMLSTAWAQYAPYYNATPQVDGKQCLTGCIATALAQILNYYQYPSQYADGTMIDWANMLPSYDGEYSDAQAKAVSLLMARIGESVNMDYGPDVSTSYPSEVVNGFVEKFGYIVKYYGYRDYPTEKDAAKWKEIVFRELSAGHPVLYGGTSYKNGNDNYFSHSFVIDGYDSNGRVHVNYGFGGNGDGYFPLDKLPLRYGNWDEEFDTYQTLVVLHRPQDGSIDYDL